MNLEGVISASDIINYTYCPRIIYFDYVLKSRQRQTSKTKEARAGHISYSKQSIRNKIVKKQPKLPRKYNVHLFSEKYNLQAVIDCLFLNGTEAYPMDFKQSFAPRAVYLTQKYQLAAHALLLKERGYVVQYAYLKYLRDGIVKKVWIKEAHIENVLKSLELIKRVVGEEYFPRPTPYKKRCVDCCFWKICRRV